MTILETLLYDKEDGHMITTEVYSDGSIRKVYIENGITNYILTGGNK